MGGPCDGFKPMVFSPKTARVMTDGEKRQVVAHNEFGEDICDWKPVR